MFVEPGTDRRPVDLCKNNMSVLYTFSARGWILYTLLLLRPRLSSIISRITLPIMHVKGFLTCYTYVSVQPDTGKRPVDLCKNKMSVLYTFCARGWLLYTLLLLWLRLSSIISRITLPIMPVKGLANKSHSEALRKVI